jgi:hypothetical protein
MDRTEFLQRTLILSGGLARLYRPRLEELYRIGMDPQEAWSEVCYEYGLVDDNHDHERELYAP